MPFIEAEKMGGVTYSKEQLREIAIKKTEEANSLSDEQKKELIKKYK